MRNPFAQKKTLSNFSDVSNTEKEESYSVMNSFMSNPKNKYKTDYANLIHCLLTIGNKSSFDWKSDLKNDELLPYFIIILNRIASDTSKQNSVSAGQINDGLILKSIKLLKLIDKRKISFSDNRVLLIRILTEISGGKNGVFLKADLLPNQVGLYQTAIALILKVSKD